MIYKKLLFANLLNEYSYIYSEFTFIDLISRQKVSHFRLCGKLRANSVVRFPRLKGLIDSIVLNFLVEVH